MPAAAEEYIEIPYNFEFRDYQQPVYNAAFATGDPNYGDESTDIDRFFILWHRRGGKDLTWINIANVKMSQRVGIYGHIFPTLTEGRRVIWEGKDRDGRPFLDYFPGHSDYIEGKRGGWVRRKRDDMMRIEVANGSTYTVLGADHPDSIRGMNIIGAMFSEYAFFKGPQSWDIIRPMLAENGGWAGFMTTPNGRNHSHALHMMSKKNPKWFELTLTVDDTHAVPLEKIQDDRDSGMSEEKVQSEYYCSYDVAVEGSFYGAAMKLMREQNRICPVPHDPTYPVDTYWDLGVRDPSAIWFAQQIGMQHRIIDFEWFTGEGLPELAKALDKKPYKYGKHYGPHDLAVREIGADYAATRLMTAQRLGLNFIVVPRRSFEDGINATRTLLAKTWIDEEKCILGIDALHSYRKKEMEGITGPKGETLYASEAEHSWASHPADAFRTGAMGKALTDALEDDDDAPTAPKIAIV